MTAAVDSIAPSCGSFEKRILYTFGLNAGRLSLLFEINYPCITTNLQVSKNTSIKTTINE